MRLDFKDFEGQFGDWADSFRPFIESKEMWEIYQTLKADKEIIVPNSDVVFRSFLKSKPWNIKSVWYLMDPYPKRYRDKSNQATGIPMDCSNSPDGKLQPSLDLFYDAMAKDLGYGIEKSPNLEYLLEQGVLLLNTDLTCRLRKTASHAKLWEPFQKFFLEEVMRKKTGIVYVMAGAASHRMEKYINPLGNHLFKIEHPAAAAYKGVEWNCKDIFKTTDKLIEDVDRNKIYWNKPDWDREDSCPF